MAITRANVESVLIARCGSLLTAAGLDGATVAGNNPDLNDPIGYALRRLGYAVASVTAVADSDLAGLAASDTDALLDLAELRALESILGNLDAVDIRLGPRDEKLSQLANRIEQRVERLQTKIAKQYAIGGAVASAGAISLDFADHNEATA